MSHDLLTTNEAAAILDVGPSTVKRWADEGRLQCVKTPGGHRRFRREDLVDLLTSNFESDKAITSDLVLDDRDEHATLAALMSMRATYGAWWIVAEHVGEFLRDVGEQWANRKLSIVQEHTISERVARALATAARILPVDKRAPTCLLVMAEGDEHTLGLSLAELVAKEAGWRTRWVGSKTPLFELAETVSEREVDAIGISASLHSTDTSHLERQASTLAELVRDSRIPVAFGGEGKWPETLPCGIRTRDFAAFRAVLLHAAV